MAQKVGRREKLAQKEGRREIYSPVPPPPYSNVFQANVCDHCLNIVLVVRFSTKSTSCVIDMLLYLTKKLF